MRDQKEYKAEWNRNFKKNNRNLIRERKRKAYWANPELAREKRRQWVINNPERYLQTYLKGSAKTRAKQQNVPFNIELSDIVVPEYCPILKWIKLERSKTGHPTYSSPTIDKIIPELGYVKGNIQIISLRANVLKSDGSIKELKALAKWIDTLSEPEIT